MFEGLEGVAQPGHEESYEPGTQAYDQSLVEELVTTYIESTGSGSKWALFNLQYSLFSHLFNSQVEETLIPRLKHASGLDAQAFLDAVVARLGAGAEQAQLSQADIFLSPLIRALYESGHSELALNIASFGVPVDEIANRISGTEERPLSLVCMLGRNLEGFDANSAGMSSRHCAIDVRGSVGNVGASSFHSSFILRGLAGRIGFYSSFCTYRLPRAEVLGLEAVTEKKVVPTELPYSCGAEVLQIEEEPLFRLSLRHEEGVAYTYLDGTFFDEARGNRLLVPDGSGGWTEVRP